MVDEMIQFDHRYLVRLNSTVNYWLVLPSKECQVLVVNKMEILDHSCSSWRKQSGWMRKKIFLRLLLTCSFACGLLRSACLFVSFLDSFESKKWKKLKSEWPLLDLPQIKIVWSSNGFLVLLFKFHLEFSHCSRFSIRRNDCKPFYKHEAEFELKNLFGYKYTKPNNFH